MKAMVVPRTMPQIGLYVRVSTDKHDVSGPIKEARDYADANYADRFLVLLL